MTDPTERDAETILLAEDDPDDRLMAKEALEESGVRKRLRFAEDGEEVIDYLEHRGRFAEAGASPYPAIILLDLNMPRKDGREVLRELKSHPRLRRIPVVVLTTSRSSDDVRAAYELGANSFVSKPRSFESLVETLRQICRYWFEVSQLPAEAGALEGDEEGAAAFPPDGAGRRSWR